MTEAFGKLSTESTIKTGAGDEVLVKRILAGEGGAFEKMISEYGGDVTKFAQRLIGWRGDVRILFRMFFWRRMRGLGDFVFSAV